MQLRFILIGILFENAKPIKSSYVQRMNKLQMANARCIQMQTKIARCIAKCNSFSFCAFSYYISPAKYNKKIHQIQFVIPLDKYDKIVFYLYNILFINWSLQSEGSRGEGWYHPIFSNISKKSLKGFFGGLSFKICYWNYI